MSDEKPNPDKISTGERAAIAQSVANAIVEKERERERERALTPLPGHGDSAVMYRIAKEVFDREQPAHMRSCENANDGPACKLSQRIDEIDEKVNEMEKAHQRDIGKGQALTRALAVVSVVASLATVGFGAWKALHSEAQAAPLLPKLIEELQALKGEIHALPSAQVKP